MENPENISKSAEPASRRKEAPEYINVAVAIIEQGGKFLVAKRAPGRDYAGKWEFPGGKIESGESAEEALRREIMEEIGMEVEIVRSLPVSERSLPDGKSFRLHGFMCKIGEEPLKLADEHAEHRWVNPAELRGLDFLDPDKVIFSFLQNQQAKNPESKNDDRGV